MPNSKDPLPPEGASLEEIAAFWDEHDTTDYPDAFVSADATFDIRHKHYEIEIREDVYQAAQQRSEKERISMSDLIDAVLRERFLTAS